MGIPGRIAAPTKAQSTTFRTYSFVFRGFILLTSMVQVYVPATLRIKATAVNPHMKP